MQESWISCAGYFPWCFFPIGLCFLVIWSQSSGQAVPAPETVGRAGAAGAAAAARACEMSSLMPVRRENFCGKWLSDFLVCVLASLLSPPEGAVLVRGGLLAWGAADVGVVSVGTSSSLNASRASS